MEEVVEKVEKVVFPAETVAPWAREIFAKFDSRLTEDVSGYKEKYEVTSFVLDKESTYIGYTAEAIRRNLFEVPLPLIAFDVLSDPNFVKTDGFLFMRQLDINEDYPVIFHVEGGKLKGFQLKKETVFPASTAILALKRK